MRSSLFGRIDAALSPAPDPARVAKLTDLPFAHRGLHGGGLVENSRSAFEAAIALGHGIELDVQASGDGAAMVFHDYELDRLTEENGPLAARDAAELRTVRLKGSDDHISTLADILALIAGRVPLLVEVKAKSVQVDTLCASVRTALAGYRGIAAVMSFNPAVGRWFARFAPEVIRGLVVTENGRGDRGVLARHLALWRARPDFLAYDLRDLPSPFAAAQRARGLPVVTWTCRGAAARERAAVHADQIIYETD